MLQAQVVTVDEFEALLKTPQSQDRLLELVHGEVIEKMPTEEHGTLAALIAHFLLAFILPRDINAHVGVEVRHQDPNDPYNSRLPDVSLRLSDVPAVSDGAVERMPDLAVEIQSPTDRPHQMREKALYYLQKGARVVWLVYPSAVRVEACTLDAAGNLALEELGKADVLTIEAILPMFRLPVGDLFRE